MHIAACPSHPIPGHRAAPPRCINLARRLAAPRTVPPQPHATARKREEAEIQRQRASSLGPGQDT